MFKFEFNRLEKLKLFKSESDRIQQLELFKPEFDRIEELELFKSGSDRLEQLKLLSSKFETPNKYFAVTFALVLQSLELGCDCDCIFAAAIRKLRLINLHTWRQQRHSPAFR